MFWSCLFGLPVDEVKDQGRRRGAFPQCQAEPRLAGLQGLEAQKLRVEVEILVLVVEPALSNDLWERSIQAGVVAHRTMHREGEETAGRVDLCPADANPESAILRRDFHPREAAEAPVVEQHHGHLLADHAPAGGHCRAPLIHLAFGQVNPPLLSPPVLPDAEDLEIHVTCQAIGIDEDVAAPGGCIRAHRVGEPFPCPIIAVVAEGMPIGSERIAGGVRVGLQTERFQVRSVLKRLHVLVEIHAPIGQINPEDGPPTGVRGRPALLAVAIQLDYRRPCAVHQRVLVAR